LTVAERAALGEKDVERADGRSGVKWTVQESFMEGKVCEIDSEGEGCDDDGVVSVLLVLLEGENSR